MGDFNVARTDEDVWDPSAFVGSTHVTPAERAAMDELEAWGLVDVRARPGKGDRAYTYFDYRAGMFHKDLGMRIDYVLATPAVHGRATRTSTGRPARARAPRTTAPSSWTSTSARDSPVARWQGRRVATLDDAARRALALPEVSEGTRYGHRCWAVAGKVFAWERPLTKADVKRYGDVPPPPGPLLAVSVADLGDKQAVLAAHGPAAFDIPHFRDYPAVLVELDRVRDEALQEVLEDAWAVAAPAAVARRHLGTG